MIHVFTDPVLSGMGATGRYDYADDDPAFENRLSRCYELSGKVFLLGGPDMDVFPEASPRPERLVHGSIHGPDADERINHAWVLLDNGQVWEPITTAICDRAAFYAYARAVDITIYSPYAAARRMLTTGHYGPWWPEMTKGAASDG